MKEKITTAESASTVCYEAMESHARSCIQNWLQDLLETEVTELLGRGKSQRRAELEEPRLGHRNGYGKPRQVALTAGTITVRRPRVRNLAEHWIRGQKLPRTHRRFHETDARIDVRD